MAFFVVIPERDPGSVVTTPAPYGAPSQDLFSPTAEAVRSAGDAERQREVNLLKAEVDRLSKRRDAITAQLASLRDVVAGFGDDDSQ